MNSNNVKNKISESNLKSLNRNQYSFDHINRISSNHKIHTLQKDTSSSSLYDTRNQINNKFNKNLDNSPIFSDNNLIYNNNNNNNININGNNNLSSNNNINNAFQNRLHDKVLNNSKPAYEFYGYAFYLVSFLSMGIWLLWAFSTESFSDKIGFTYYPKRYWAIVLPDYIVISILFYVVIFLCYNFIHTPSFDSLNTITDKHSNLMKNVKYTRLEEDDDIPDLQDIPISIVNAYLYSDSFNLPGQSYSTYSPS